MVVYHLTVRENNFVWNIKNKKDLNKNIETKRFYKEEMEWLTTTHHLDSEGPGSH